MKKWLLIGVGLFLVACTPSYEASSKATSGVLSSTLPKNLVKQIKKRFNNNGYLEFELILYSTFAKDVIYKVNWLDEEGFVLRDVLNEDYEALRIPAGQEVIIRKLSSNVRVKDARIELKAKN